MTSMPARPHDFGAWAPTVAARPLGDVARPAAARVRRQVLFSTVPGMWVNGGARQVEVLLDHATGPTRCSPIVVQACFTEDQVDRALADPLLAHMPVAQLAHARAGWDACPRGWVLLIGHCRVLWQQTAMGVRYS